jgi:hypothetical protein
VLDPTGWVEVEDQAFAPGMFLWNSEVGRRTVGISTFWTQAVCGKHLIDSSRDAAETEWKHTSKVSEALSGIRRAILMLVGRCDQRKDDFGKIVRRAMAEKLGDDAEEVVKELAKQGFQQRLSREAVRLTLEAGRRFTVFNVVNALTRLAREIPFAGDCTGADEKASQLLSAVMPDRFGPV